MTRSQASFSFKSLEISLEISIGSRYFVSLYKFGFTRFSNSIPSPKTPILIPSLVKFYKALQGHPRLYF